MQQQVLIYYPSHYLLIITGNVERSVSGSSNGGSKGDLVAVNVVEDDNEQDQFQGSFVDMKQAIMASIIELNDEMENLYGSKTPYQYTISIHYINTSCQCTLSVHPVNTPYQCTLSIHPINTSCQHLLHTPLTHSIRTYL